MIVSIFSFSVIDSIALIVFNLEELYVFQRLLLHLMCIPLVGGFSYEVLKILAKNMDKNFIIKFLCTPGLLLQKITTNNWSIFYA